MNKWQIRLIRMAKRKFPDEVKHWGDKEILERWTMDGSFKKGFSKSAAHVLAEISLNSDTNEAQEERHQILEDSYAKERGELPSKNKDAVKEEYSAPSKDPQYASFYN